MDNVNKHEESEKIEGLVAVDKDNEIEEEIEIITINSTQGINESNLMTIPFISLKNTKVKILERYWESNGIKRGIKVKGSVEYGCPTVSELDVLLALFRILLKNIGYKYQYNRTTGKVNIPQTINFTYRELAKELGYKSYGGSIKEKLNKSIRILIETTIYTTFGIRDASMKDYVDNFNGEESTRILKNYKEYSYTRERKKGGINSNIVKEKQSVDIDDFFFKNICNNFFKIFDYSRYVSLNKGISKKIYLLLCQWSHGYEKFLYYDTLYDYLSFDVTEDKKRYYYNRLIKESLEELKKIKFIDDFEISTSEGVNLIFNENRKKIAKGKYKYKTDEEVITKLQEYGLSISEWTKYFRMDNSEYVKGLLRYVDNRVEKGLVPNPKEYLLKGLKNENYNISEYMD